MIMRYVAIAVVLMLGGPAYSQDYTSSGYCTPWCSLSYGRDCSYHTFQQCLDASRGATNSCYSNPFLYQCRRPSVPNRSGRRR
jgi:hypothetical protein